MVINWPAGIRDKGGVRSQFHHVSDIMPTVLDIAGVKAPASLNDVPQQPLDGISMRYTFDHPQEASHRTMQVFAMAQSVSIYKDGWVAASRQAATPWDKRPVAPYAPAQRVWELFDVAHDYSEAHDLAAANPAKLEQLKGLFWAEAARRQMLPLMQSEGGQAGMPTVAKDRGTFVYDRPIRHVAATAAPNVVNRSFSIDARISVAAGANGVLLAHGGRYSGYSLYLKDGVPIFTYNNTPLHFYRTRSPIGLVAGDHAVLADFRYEGGVGGPATIILSVDGKQVASGRIDSTMPTIISHTEGFDIGSDSVTAVDDLYTPAQSRFDGKINRITVTVAPK
jgi:arylsulfatase